MSEEREPLRLRDDPSEASGLRAMLEAAQGEAPDPAMLDRVLGNVLAGGGGGGGSGGGGGGAAAAKLAAAATAGVLGAGVIAWMMSGTSVAPPPRTPVPSAIVIVDAASEADAFVDLDAGAVVDVGVDAFVVARIDRRLPPPPVTEAETDVALLMRAAREHDPAAQLALAREHGARFPNSPSAEDRESIIVLALARLGRRAEATAAADAFRARWPRSPALPHIDAALARMPPQ